MPSKSNLDYQLRLIAKLYFLDGLGQTEIAEIVGVSRTKVSRLLSKARDLGIVQIRIQGYDPRNRDLEDQLKTQLNLHHVIVINTTQGASTSNVRRTIGYLAAPIISDLLQSHTNIGIAGGRTISELIRSIEPNPSASGGAVITLMGHIGPTVSGIDALQLSHIIADQLNRTQYTLNAPAFSEDVNTRNTFLNHAQVNSVIGLFSNLELAMVGVGALNESAWIERGVINPENLEHLHQQGAVGEMVGRFFNENGVECDSELRDRVISIELDQLRQVNEVIAVTNGPIRAEAVLAAVKGNLIKSLVIDDVGAKAILKKTNG